MDKDKSEHIWVCLDGIILKYSDKKVILEGHELHDLHIDICQKSLKCQYPGLKGLFSTSKPFRVVKLGSIATLNFTTPMAITG